MRQRIAGHPKILLIRQGLTNYMLLAKIIRNFGGGNVNKIKLQDF